MPVRACDERLVEEARRLWLDGARDAEVVRFLMRAAPEPYYLGRDLYIAAFLVNRHIDRAFIGADRFGWTDGELDRFLDRWITEARLGGLLTAERIARYLGTQPEVIHAALLKPENKRRVGGRTSYGQKGEITRHELFATPELLRELEAKFLPDRPRRYPYWETRSNDKVADAEPRRCR